MSSRVRRGEPPFSTRKPRVLLKAIGLVRIVDSVKVEKRT